MRATEEDEPRITRINADFSRAVLASRNGKRKPNGRLRETRDTRWADLRGSGGRSRDPRRQTSVAAEDTENTEDTETQRGVMERPFEKEMLKSSGDGNFWVSVRAIVFYISGHA
jgi:hypothetical protein